MNVDNSGKEVLFYIGEDLSELQFINHLIPGVIALGLRPVLLETQKKPSENPDAYTQEMDLLSFYHRDILQDTIIPFMDARRPYLTDDGDLNPKIIYTPNQLSSHYGLEFHDVADVNSAEHYEYCMRKKESGNVLMSLSGRCTHILHDPIVNLLRSMGPVINAHPGKLPRTRGVLPVLWAMIAKDVEIQWSAQAIVDKTVDTGPVYRSTSQPIEKNKSVFHHYNNNTQNVSAMMLGLVDEVSNGISIPSYDLDLSQKLKPNTYPEERLTDAFLKAGGRMVEPRAQMADFYAKIFGGKGPYRQELDVVIRQAQIDKFDATPKDKKSPQINSFLNGLQSQEPVNDDRRSAGRHSQRGSAEQQSEIWLPSNYRHDVI